MPPPPSRARTSGASSVRSSVAPASRPSAGPSNRQSVAPGTAPAARGAGMNLPAYEAPIAPLSDEARAQLANLLESTYSLRKLTATLERSQKQLRDIAGDLHDNLRERTQVVETKKRKRREKISKEGADNVERDEALEAQEMALMQYKDKIESATMRLDVSTRKNIDAYAGVQNATAVLKDLHRQAEVAAEQSEAFKATQQATQPSQRRRVIVDDEENADANSEGDVTQQPSNAAASTSNTTAQSQASAPSMPSLTPAFLKNLSERTDTYTAQSLSTRYANHNDYKDLKRVIHDAQHPDDGIELAPSRMWFAKEEGREEPEPGTTNAGAGADGDEDDDIAIARVTISTRCPITLIEFVDPVTSRVCKHSFERAAIMSMIKGVRPPTRGRHQPPPADWTPSVKCPKTGCFQMIEEGDLETDAVLVRKIGKIQRTKALEEQGGATWAEGGGEGVEDVGSGEESEVEDVDQIGAVKSVKSERVRKSIEDDDAIEED